MLPLLLICVYSQGARTHLHPTLLHRISRTTELSSPSNSEFGFAVHQSPIRSFVILVRIHDHQLFVVLCLPIKGQLASELKCLSNVSDTNSIIS